MVWATGDRRPWGLVFLLSLALAMAAALLSWHGIEKWALRLAHRKRPARPPPDPEAAAGGA